MLDTFARLRVLNLNRVELFGHKLHDWNPLEWAGAMCGEAGEAANVAKKLRRIAQGCRVNTGEASEEEMIRKLGTEIAGTIVYADLLAASVGLDLRSIVIEEFDRVSKRVDFPTKFVDENATPGWRAWLIQRHMTPAGQEYLTYEGGEFTYTTDPLKAMHFARREDADRIASESNDDVKLCDHEFAD